MNRIDRQQAFYEWLLKMGNEHTANKKLMELALDKIE